MAGNVKSKLSGIQLPGNKNVVILLGALLLGGSGVFLAQDFLEAKAEEYRARYDNQSEMVEVVVPKRDLIKGTHLTPADLAKRKIPTKFAHRDSVLEQNFRNALGQRVAFDVEAGKPLLWAHLESGGSATFSGIVPNGMRALTVPVDRISSISGFLQPQDRIDLLMTYKPGREEETVPLLQNVLVLATGQITEMDTRFGEGRERAYNTVTLQVTPDDAKRIILAQKAGKLTAVLRHPEDNDEMSKAAMTVAKLIEKEPRPVRRYTPPKPAPRKKGVEFIIGGI
jgi:pilus assembly protein CpaB